MVCDSLSNSLANVVRRSSCNGSVQCRRAHARPLSTCSFVMLLLTIHAVVFVCPVEASRCSGCYNGGQLFLPTSIFGPCRCLCDGHFAGPQCEFVGKRSSDRALGPDEPELSAADNALDDTRLESKLSFLKDMWVQLRNDQDDLGSLQSASGTAHRTRTPKSKRRLTNNDIWL